MRIRPGRRSGAREAPLVRHREDLRGGLRKIEATQAALRESIEQTKALAAKAEDLLNAHKKTLKKTQSED